MKTEKILLLRESLESRRQVHLDLIINEKNKKKTHLVADFHFLSLKYHQQISLLISVNKSRTKIHATKKLKPSLFFPLVKCSKNCLS